MGTRSLQADSLPQSRKKRSFSLPSFRKSSAGERQEAARSAEEVAKSAEEAARVQKAAAWQWYTRGVVDAVVPTKRPPVSNSAPSQLAPIHDKSRFDCRSKGGEAITKVLHKKPLEPPLSEPPRAASRFKAEASFTRPTSSGAPPPPSAAPSTPLYDEFELSGLRTQMADFVQRLQHQQTKDNVQSPDVGDQQKPKPLHIAGDGRPFPAATSVSTDHQLQSKAPPPDVAAATNSSDHRLTKLPPPATPAASTIPFHVRPFSALHRFFRKVVPGSVSKSTKNSPLNIHISSPTVYEPEVVPEDDDNTQRHYHHYIHHHHHHYHYGHSPEESAATIRSRRRHSESSRIRPRILSLWEEESVAEEEVEESPIDAYLARRRRYSDSFAGHVTPKKAPDEDEAMNGVSAKVESPPQFQRGYNSERFSPNKIPMVSKELKQPAAGGNDECNEGLRDIKCRRRHSTDNYREEAFLEREIKGGGKSGGGTYKLGRAADGATPPKLLVRRRHSESLQRPEVVHYEMGKRTPSPGRPYCHSPSARYYEDVLEHHIGAPVPANATGAGPPRRAVLPPLYPK